MKKAVVVLPLISLFLVSFSLPVHSNPVDDCIWQNLDDHGSIMLLIDPEKGSVEYGNQAAAAFFGYPADALAGLPLAELTAGSLDELAAIWEEALAQEENSFVLERRLASGETRAVEIYVYPYRLEGREMFFSIIHDITEEKQLAARERLMAAAYFISLVAIIGCLLFINHLREEDLQQVIVLMNGVWQAKEKREAVEKLTLERKKYYLTLLSIGDGVMVVDREGRIEILNGVGQKLTGWPAHEAVGRHYQEVFVLAHEGEGQEVQDPIAAALATERIQKLDDRAVLISRDGKRYHLEDSAAPIKDSTGATIGAVLVFRDVTAEKKQRKKIEYLSYRDPLTGLYNRRFIEEKLQELDGAENLPLSIIVGDINSLKLVNDIFGHTYGDLLLQQTAEVFRRVLRAGDIVARWGGDEFLVLLPKTGAREVEKIVARIKDEAGQEYIRGIQGTISLGYATKEKGEQGIRQVLQAAEDAMYTEKSLGRDSNDRRMLGNLLAAFHKASARERGHAERVTQLCRNFGIKLGLSPRELEQLVEASFLHDLGKIVLDGEVVNKVGVLTEQEWSQVKRHPVVGCRILKLFDETFDLADIVLTHHERWDGRGYPMGLAGEEIPLLARIVSLVEAYDAMVSGFYSGHPLAREEALGIIEAGAGSQFDPQLAPAFCRFIAAG